MKSAAVWTAVAIAGAAAVASAQDAQVTIEDQTDVAVTVYNNDLALVRDRRTATLANGEGRLQFADVAQMIRPETVSLTSISHPGAVAVLEQNYEFDLISPDKLMEKYVGMEVLLRNFNSEINTEIEQTATLLSVNGGPVYKVGEQIYLGYPGNVVLPEIPENLVSRPSLVWTLNSSQPQQEIEATYLTGGVSWQADYVLTVNKETTRMDVAGWVTLVNNSGATYENAQLKLVAGEVNQAPPMMAKGGRAYAMAEMAMAAPAPDMRQESFAEYHLYSLPRRTTIKQNQSKQVSLLTAEEVGVKKVYEYRGNESYYSQQGLRLENERVDVMVVFENEEANNLGMPLPGGVYRIYQADSDGMLQFAGEDRVDHTPKDEQIRLKMGQAFDIVAERTITDFQVIADRVHESAVEVVIRNHKEEAVTVDVVEPMSSDWEIRSQSHEHVKKDARTAIFSLPVPAGGEVTLTYRVRIRY